MLKNSWSATALAALLSGSFCLPAMAQTPVSKFLEVVKSGWKVEIGTRSSGNQIILVRIADRAQTDKFVDIAVGDGAVQDSEVWKATKFLTEVARASDRRAELGLLATPFDANRPGSLPDGLHLRSGSDGTSTITDDRRSAVGRIEKGASVARKEEVVVDALAKRAADNLISNPTSVSPVSSAVMKATKKMVDADVDALVAEPGADQLLGGAASDKDVAQLKFAQTISRLSSLEDAVSDALVDKGRKADKRMYATELKAICDKNQFALQFLSSRDPSNIDSYRIVDPNNADRLVAAGTLSKSPFGGDKLFLKTQDLRALREQIEDATLFRSAVDSQISDDQRSAFDTSEDEVKRFIEEESKADPTIDPERNDPNSTGGGKPQSGEDPSGSH